MPPAPCPSLDSQQPQPRLPQGQAQAQGGARGRQEPPRQGRQARGQGGAQGRQEPRREEGEGRRLHDHHRDHRRRPQPRPRPQGGPLQRPRLPRPLQARRPYDHLRPLQGEEGQGVHPHHPQEPPPDPRPALRRRALLPRLPRPRRHRGPQAVLLPPLRRPSARLRALRRR